MAATLVLNASYEPLCVIPLRRAVVLVLAEKATVVSAGAGVIRSEHVSVALPSVIRLTHYVRVPYRVRAHITRAGVLRRDGFRCAYCVHPATTIDHVVPRSRGGAHRWENVVAACSRCNHRKGSKLLSELGWQLGFTPVAPAGTQAIVIAIARADPAWAPYLAWGATPS